MRHLGRRYNGLTTLAVWTALALWIVAGAAPAQDVVAPVQGTQAPLNPAPETTSPTPPEGTNVTTGTSPASAEVVPSELDYSAWEALAAEAEAALEDPASSSATMELLRAQLADWRESLLLAQSTNSSRIATLRQQIAALGPMPAEGETEVEEIATRRAQLTEQLVRLQAPSIAAEEAYRRADGLIGEIDRIQRERQADALLQLLPSPMNPANWPDAFRALNTAVLGIGREVSRRWDLPNGREALYDNLPGIFFLLALAVALIWRGRQLIETLMAKLMARSSVRGMRISALALSLGQIVIPTLGVIALSNAMRLSGLFGIVGTVMIETLPGIGFLIFAAYWLGGQLFPRSGDLLPLKLSPERRAEGRLHVTFYGIVLGVDTLRKAIIDHQALPETARAVLEFPAIVLAAFILFRLGRLLRISSVNEAETDDPQGFRGRVISILGRGALAIGVVGPLLAAIGYIPAAAAMIFPAVTSLGVIGLLFLLQVLVLDIYVLITRSEDDGRSALMPVLVGFGLVLASLPLFALIWGARIADLTELWTRLREGFQIGDTRISPTDFLIFALVFAFGFMLTRLFQGALKGSILPRTRLDQGARNALVSGTGYVGIFLAALIAINSAGIDLSGLAIVAGALSVGIGFGLQNIVSNFVSGIILLIERPVSEGDWIEVGGVQGTVKAISVRSTRIQTFDRTDVIVPNTDLVAGRVTNWTRFNLTGRLIVPVGVAYGTDTRKVDRVLREIAEAQPLALLNPAPVIAFMGLGADSMDFEIRVILRDVNFSLSVRSEINHQIVQRFKEEGIEIPFTQTDITLRNAGEIAGMLGGALAAPAKIAPPKTAEPPATQSAARPIARDLEPGEGLRPNDDDSEDT
jgi:potassium-dependent mechanosensitive channel